MVVILKKLHPFRTDVKRSVNSWSLWEISFLSKLPATKLTIYHLLLDQSVDRKTDIKIFRFNPKSYHTFTVFSLDVSTRIESLETKNNYFPPVIEFFSGTEFHFFFLCFDFCSNPCGTICWTTTRRTRLWWKVSLKTVPFSCCKDGRIRWMLNVTGFFLSLQGRLIIWRKAWFSSVNQENLSTEPIR